jgi:hypothetical protein
MDEQTLQRAAELRKGCSIGGEARRTEDDDQRSVGVIGRVDRLRPTLAGDVREGLKLHDPWFGRAAGP